MPSEIRRAHDVNLDRFVERLDERLRAEVPVTRRAALPIWVNRAARSMRVRLSILMRGGAMVMTALAVLVAIGSAPAAPGAELSVTSGLHQPALTAPSVLVIKGTAHLASIDGTLVAAAWVGDTHALIQ